MRPIELGTDLYFYGRFTLNCYNESNNINNVTHLRQIIIIII